MNILMGIYLHAQEESYLEVDLLGETACTCYIVSLVPYCLKEILIVIHEDNWNLLNSPEIIHQYGSYQNQGIGF